MATFPVFDTKTAGLVVFQPHVVLQNRFSQRQTISSAMTFWISAKAVFETNQLIGMNHCALNVSFQ